MVAGERAAWRTNDAHRVRMDVSRRCCWRVAEAGRVACRRSCAVDGGRRRRESACEGGGCGEGVRLTCFRVRGCCCEEQCCAMSGFDCATGGGGAAAWVWYMRLRVNTHRLATVVTACVTFRLCAIRADRFGEARTADPAAVMKYGSGNSPARVESPPDSYVHSTSPGPRRLTISCAAPAWRRPSRSSTSMSRIRSWTTAQDRARWNDHR